MFRVNIAFIGDYVPRAIGPLLQIHNASLSDDFSTAKLRRLGVSERDSGRINVAFNRVIDRAEEMLRVHERINLGRLSGR